MAITEFSAALSQVATERGIPVESVLESIITALKSAYKRDYGGDVEEIDAQINPETGEAKILKNGKDVTPSGFGRIAAQTAKQVILQKIREAEKIRETEKEAILDDFKGKIGTIVNGHIFRIENGVVIMDLGKAQGILPQAEQVSSEAYRLNQRLKVLVKDVRQGIRNTEIIVTRADPQLIKKLFEHEVPEVASGVVTIEAMAREAGSRTKMAVSSREDKVDPVGSCVGQKGVRVQSIIAELFGEKIDIVPYSDIAEKFIASSLSPAKVTEVDVNLETKEAKVSVPEDQLSLAIGKDGQNVRLAAKLTKWRIDIKGAPDIFGSVESTKDVAADKAIRGVWDADIKIKAEKKAKKTSPENPEDKDKDLAKEDE